MSSIKLGLAGRDEDIARYCDMLTNMGRLGIGLLCFNFMAYFGWYRTGTGIEGRGGALISDFDASKAEAHGPTELGTVTHEAIWDNFTYFIRRVIPAAEKAGVRMGLHPDDRPVPSLRGVGRVFTNVAALERALDIAASPALGVTFCQGTLHTAGEDVPTAVRRLGRDRIAFVHIRNVRGQAHQCSETFPDEGDIDMAAAFAAYRDLGLACPIRPDHAPAAAFNTPQVSLIEGILHLGKVAVLFGASGTGKTFVVLNIANAIATGRDRFGRKVTQKGVYYFAAEGEGGLNVRLAALRKKQESNAKLFKTIVGGGADFYQSDDDALEIARIVNETAKNKGHEPGLVMIDTMAMTMGDGNENNAADMTKYTNRASIIRRKTGATVLIIHHTGKDLKKGLRESTALGGVLDTTIEIKEHKSRRKILLSTPKQRDLGSGPINILPNLLKDWSGRGGPHV